MEINNYLVTATLLLFFMVMGIHIIYSGITRFKNSLTSLCLPFLLIPILFFLWTVLGKQIIYSASWSNIFQDYFSSSEILLGFLDISGTNSSLYLLFQFLFGLIATLLLWGSTLERVSIKFILFFSSLWFLVVYCPVARWIINGAGWLNELHVVDFAGGFTVHITSGFSALILAITIGRRRDYFNLINKFNQGYIFFGTFLIWIGWFGFNCGSSLILNESSLISFENTFVASITSLFVWITVDYLYTPHRTTLTGMSLGLISGLVAITPGAGLVSSTQALIIGISSGFACNFSSRLLHKVFKVDDVSDIFCSHGIGGVVGALLTGYFYTNSLKINFIATVAICSYSIFATWILTRALSKFITFRISKQEEEEGLDVKYFGERVTNI